MQNSELFRRGIVLPLDDRAEQSLRANQVDAAAHVQHLPITSTALFEDLWRHGLFDEINQRCGTLIDDYEEEFVEVADLQGLIEAVKAAEEKAMRATADVQSFLVKLHSLAATASRLDRPIVFVL